VVWLGSLKSSVTSEDAREQVTGFNMAGDMVGFDGMGTDAHACDVVALEDTEVCVFPYSRIEELAETMPALRRHFYRLMSCEIVRKHGSMLMLGSMQADERLATFLLDLADRFERRGYSSREFMLRMTRAEIGSYLGLTLETVSRVMSQFTRDGLIALSGVKQVRLTDLARLRQRAVGRDVGRAEPAPVRVAPAAPVARPPVTRVVREERIEEFA
jgi:CRP/FNR family transcriptional regulator